MNLDLPNNWVMVLDKNKLYYFNILTRKSQWTHPSSSKQLYLKEKFERRKLMSLPIKEIQGVSSNRFSPKEVPVYTLVPDRKKPERLPPFYIEIFEHSSENTERRKIAFTNIINRIQKCEWTGMRDIQSEYCWMHVGDKKKGGYMSDELELHLKEQLKNPTETIIIVGNSPDKPTACVCMNMEHKGVNTIIDLDASWDSVYSYISLVSSSDDASAGHASYAMKIALLYAKEKGKYIVLLDSLKTSLLWYINTFFTRDVYPVILNDDECFERSRAYALGRDTSTEETEDIGQVLTLPFKSKLSTFAEVAFILYGRKAVTGMNYSDFSRSAPTSEMLKGDHIEMYYVSNDNPIVIGYSYRVINFHSTKESVLVERENSYFAGKFVGLIRNEESVPVEQLFEHWDGYPKHKGFNNWQIGDVAVFSNSDRLIGVKNDGNIAFRRSFVFYRDYSIDTSEEIYNYKLVDINVLPNYELID